jgi:hypothetical protein
MKKAQLKQLREFIKSLPDIPIIHEGKAKTMQVLASSSILRANGFSKDNQNKPLQDNAAYTQQDKPLYVNKEAFFIDCDKQGKTAQQAVDLWNEKYATVTKLLASYVPPEPKPKSLLETPEEYKQRVSDEHEKQERKLHTRNGKVRGYRRKR